jgi:DNA-binding winged helix-turn-helix (wHTH) protein
VQRAGQVVSREELQKTLWPADTFVEFEHGIDTAVKKIRQALNDSAEILALSRPCLATVIVSSLRSSMWRSQPEY